MLNCNDLVVLAHTDYMIDVSEQRSWGEHRVLETRHLSTLRAGGVDIICDHVGGRTKMFSTFQLKKMLSFSDSMERALHGVDCMCGRKSSRVAKKIKMIETIDDVKILKNQNQLGLVLCLQGGSPIKEDSSHLRIFY